MKIFILLSLLIASIKLQAQTLPPNFNLVPNSGFEFISNSSFDDTDFVDNKFCWIGANKWGVWLSRVSVGLDKSDPRPHNGKYFSTIITGLPRFNLNTQQIIDTPSVTNRSYSETKLIYPLLAGETYYFSMYVGATKNAVAFTLPSGIYWSAVIANVGVLFSDTKIGNYTNYDILNASPQINFINWNIPLFDTFMYIKLTGTYVAQGGEKYMTIGNFDAITNCTFLNTAYVDPNIYPNPEQWGGTAPIMIDDVSLVRDTTLPLISLREFNLPNDTLICPGENLTIGGDSNFFHYYWNTGDTTQYITINQPGTYWCQVDYGCNTYTDTIVVGNKSDPIPAFDIRDTALCPGESFTASAPLGHAYLWSTGATSSSIHVATLNKYWVQVTNNCSISVSDTFLVVSKDTPIAPFALGDVQLCPGTSYLVSGPPGYTYLWSTGATTQDIYVNTAGTYWLRASNLCGTSFTDTFTATAIPTVQPFDIRDTALCPGETAALRGPAGYYYQWSTGSNAIATNVATPGKYWLLIRDDCGLTYTDTFVVTDKNIPITPFDIRDTALCPGESFTASGPAGYTSYLWNTGATTSSIIIGAPGTYWLKISNDCGTSYTDTIHVADRNVPIVPFDIADIEVCFTGNYAVSAPLGAEHYLWSTGATTPVITITTPGRYWVELSNGCGLVYRDTFMLTDKNIPIVPFSINDTVMCLGDSYAVSAPPGFAGYAWSTGATTQDVSISAAGNYSVTVTNDCGATYTEQFAVHVIDPHIDLGNDTLICSGQQVYTLSIPQSLGNAIWSTGSTANSIVVDKPGTYSVQVQTPCGTISDEIYIGFCPPQISSLTPGANNICVSECIEYAAAVADYPQQYTWTFPGGSPATYLGSIPPTVCYNHAGTFTTELVVSNAGGLDTSSITINVLPGPDARFTDTTIIIPYKNVVLLDACAEGLHTNWYKGATPVCVDCKTLEIIVSDAEAVYSCVVATGECMDTCIYKVIATDIATNDAWLPDAFTPNGDGRNDYFHLLTTNPNITITGFSVFNRWGQRVFYTDKNDKGWDGVFNNVPQDAGTYFWVLEYIVTGNHEGVSLKGNVSLIR